MYVSFRSRYDPVFSECPHEGAWSVSTDVYRIYTTCVSLEDPLIFHCVCDWLASTRGIPVLLWYSAWCAQCPALPGGVPERTPDFVKMISGPPGPNTYRYTYNDVPYNITLFIIDMLTATECGSALSEDY